jgi:two-component system response regulator DctR
MQPTQNAQIFIIDDDAGVREALAWLLRSRRLSSQCFESADAFVAQWRPDWLPDQPSCMLLDVRMPGMSGLALFEWLIERDLLAVCPVIFLTGHADIPTAVDSVKRGAFDFCEKPFSDNALVDRIELALQRSAEVLEKVRARKTVQARLDDLTERERDVMRLVVEGLPNKLIADQLDISVRTVEVHRARVFDKMAVKSAVELANLLRGADKEN